MGEFNITKYLVLILSFEFQKGFKFLLSSLVTLKIFPLIIIKPYSMHLQVVKFKYRRLIKKYYSILMI